MKLMARDRLISDEEKLSVYIQIVRLLLEVCSSLHGKSEFNLEMKVWRVRISPDLFLKSFFVDTSHYG